MSAKLQMASIAAAMLVNEAQVYINLDLFRQLPFLLYILGREHAQALQQTDITSFFKK